MTGYRRPCIEPGCGKPDYALRRCRLHYERHAELRRASGVDVQVPAGPVAAHARLLRWRGWALDPIAAAGGIHRRTLVKLLVGELSTLRDDKAACLLAVEPAWQLTAVSVPVVGTRRRLDALAWQGWPARWVGAELGMGQKRISNALGLGQISARSAAAVAGFYDTHAYRAGPDATWAKRSRLRGCLPAWVWDEDGSIEDPATQPAGKVRPGSRVAS